MNQILQQLPSQEAIKQHFGQAYFFRGISYYQSGRVLYTDFDSHSGKIFAEVQGSGRHIYQVVLGNEGSSLSYTCSCPIGGGCKHVVAALLSLLEQKKSGQKSTSAEKPVDKWLKELQSHQADQAGGQCERAHEFQLIYLINPSGYCKKSDLMLIDVKPMLCRVLKRGGLGKAKIYRPTTPSHQKYLTEQDEELIFKLAFETERDNLVNKYDAYGLQYQVGSQLFEAFLSTEKCFLNDEDNEARPQLSLGKEKSFEFKWTKNENGMQCLHHNLPKAFQIISLDPLWYYDPSTSTCGKLCSELPNHLLLDLLEAPTIPPESAASFSKQLKKLEPNVPLPKGFGKPVVIKNIVPRPCLRLQEIKLIEGHEYFYPNRFYADKTIRLAGAVLGFYYHNRFVGIHDDQTEIHFVKDNNLNQTVRDIDAERQFETELDRYIELSRVTGQNGYYGADRESRHGWLLGAKREGYHLANDEEVIKPFLFHTVPALEDAGWQIEIDASFPYHYINESAVEWYAEIDDSEYDWFGFKLGIAINGEQINILPLLVSLLSTHRDVIEQSLATDEKLTMTLPDGRLLPVPAHRIKNIVEVLIELFDANALNSDGELKLSRLQAAQMLELQAAMGAAQLRWIGGERLLSLGKKLQQFSGLKKATIPKNFKATLRPYQQSGVDWLQFLREYNLAGILADDMGLGKTVQTLAHIEVERAEKRLTLPSLIVMPTSLITNWMIEAKRFAPELKVLKLHGNDRHQHFDSLDHYDLVLTSYPLLVRDKAELIKQSFYFLILDEAQFIKNAKAKSTQIVHQIKAAHRLCLTGTPMENHLGELWSLMHFLMPGFLGNAQQFNARFRRPIEKDNHEQRRIFLANRVKPFMLRREKAMVLKELPPKNEMIQHVVIDSAQRDLYESVRLAMHKKVKEAISSKGFSRSHILILDALLKLRQVCCDPRLVKLKAAEKAHGTSAKLSYLMEMLPSLVEEGRRILLFSQFTSMLALIEDTLNASQLNYVKLTGQTKDRETPIRVFQNEEVPIFLISLKAGGTGLNLTAADTVIHYDPWWNPAVEDQATDRAHRIGQQKSVFVYKLIAQGTVEETILEMQKKKRKLISSLYSTEKSGKAKLTNEDLNKLFQPLMADD